MSIITTNSRFFKSNIIKNCFSSKEGENSSLWCALCKPGQDSQLWLEDKIYQKLSDNTTQIINEGVYYSIYFVCDLSNDPDAWNYIKRIMMTDFALTEEEALEIYNAESIFDRICYTSTTPGDWETVKTKLDNLNRALESLPWTMRGCIFFDIAAKTTYDSQNENLPVELTNNLTNNVFYPNGIKIIIDSIYWFYEEFIEFLILQKGLTREEATNILEEVRRFERYTLYENIGFNNIDNVIKNIKKYFFGNINLGHVIIERDPKVDTIFRVPPRLNNQLNIESLYSDSLNPHFSPTDISEVTGLVSFVKIKDIYFCEKCKRYFSLSVKDDLTIYDINEEKLNDRLRYLIEKNKNYCLLFDIVNENKTIDELVEDCKNHILEAIESSTDKIIINSKEDFVKIKNIIKEIEKAGIITIYDIDESDLENSEFTHLYENNYSLLNKYNDEEIIFENQPINWKRIPNDELNFSREEFYLAIEFEDEVKNNSSSQIDNISRIFMFSNVEIDPQYQEKDKLTIEEINSGAIIDLGHCVIEDYFIPYERKKNQVINIRYVVKI